MKQPTVHAVQAATAAHFGIEMLDLLSDRRWRRVSEPRQVAMWLATRVTTKSLPAIGRAFHRDHTTVGYAVEKVDAKLRSDSAFRASVFGLLRQFSNCGDNVNNVDSATNVVRLVA